MIEALSSGISKAYVPAIRASKDWGKRPTAVIMRDDWFGHRDPFTGMEMGDRDTWTEWDHLLVDAYQTLEDYSDDQGILRWVHDDEYVEINANKRINKFKQAVDLSTAGSDKKPYKPTPGEYFVPDVFTRRKDADGNEIYQTRLEWIKTQAEASTVN